MGQQQSREELLFQQINYRDINAIKDLHRNGVSLECVNREGATPLMAACMNPELYGVAQTLIELGANVNAYRRGQHGGTALHHAARRGLVQTVELLLLNGANALLMNDHNLTPLEVARAKGFANVVRKIEGHICLFSGWLRELYGPGFLELLAPQFLSRKVWAVVVPCGSRNLQKPFRLELAVYDRLQDAQPRMTIALWKANMQDPAFNQSDLAVVISETAGISRGRRQRRCRTRHIRQAYIKLAPLNEKDRKQLQQFCDACKGIPQVMHTAFPFNAPAPFANAAASQPTEDLELAMAINASLQSAMEQGIPVGHVEAPSGAGASSSAAVSSSFNTRSDNASLSVTDELHPPITNPGSSSPPLETPSLPPPSVPSAPLAPPLGDDKVQYPSIDFGAVTPDAEIFVTSDGEKEEGEKSSSCVVCLDAPVEGACVPCGHMAGCMPCLDEIKTKKWGCPICRAEINQVIKVYTV